MDLYIEVRESRLMQKIRCKVQLQERLDMPVDLIVKPIGDTSPISQIAKKEGSCCERTHRPTAVLLYMEKLGCLDSVDRWKEIRELRNPVNHEYED